MKENAPASGRLGENIVHFARVLRKAGIPLGPASVVDAVRAVEIAGIHRRDDFYWTLHSIFATRRDQHATFDEWWEPFGYGVGPAGAYLVAQPHERRQEIRAACEELLGRGPFTVEGRAWCAAGTV